MKIEIVVYKPEWKELFLHEKERLEGVLEKAAFIDHIGSTSVPGLCAKPIIDILIGVNDFNLADSFINKIELLGYSYIEKYNEIIPDRRYFKKETGQRVHIHLVEYGSQFWKRHLLFRDYLRINEEAMAEYAMLKKDLAQKDWLDGNEYAAAKTIFIKSIEAKAEKLIQ